MEQNEVCAFLEKSFLSPLLNKEDVTDITFNGDSLYYVSNSSGRKLSDISVEESLVRDFIRQIANLCEKQFSFSSPILDVSFGKYRLNAVHHSVGKVENNEAITFALRIASNKPKINDDSSFLNARLVSLFNVLIRSKSSILIAGSTGSGKTEFQKYLLRKVNSNSRVIVIDNVSELEATRDNKEVDLTFWRSEDRNEYTTIPFLIKNALRCNPDWLIIAESRGGEMEDVLNSALTGTPIISTFHSLDIFSMPNRVISMVMMNNKRTNRKEILNDLTYHIRFYIFLEKIIDENGYIVRRIKSIGEINEDGSMNIIYDFSNKKEIYRKISKNTCKNLIFDEKDDLFIKTFFGDNHE